MRLRRGYRENWTFGVIRSFLDVNVEKNINDKKDG